MRSRERVLGPFRKSRVRYVLARSSTLPSRTFESHFSRRTFARPGRLPARARFLLSSCLFAAATAARESGSGGFVLSCWLVCARFLLTVRAASVVFGFRPTITASSLNSWTVRELNISAVPACASVNRVVGVLREFGCDRFRTDDSDLTDGEGVGRRCVCRRRVTRGRRVRFGASIFVREEKAHRRPPSSPATPGPRRFGVPVPCTDPSTQCFPCNRKSISR